MDITQQVVIIVLSSSGFTGLLYFILKRLFQKQLDKNLETHKGEVNKGLETHKGEIKTESDIQLESYKGEIKKETDSYLETHKGIIQEKLENFKDSNIKENLESTRFVDVICRQRIDWLEKLRNDIAELVSFANILVGTNKINENINQMTLWSLFLKGTSEEAKQKIFNEFFDTQKELKLDKSNLLKSSTTLKLRLNIVDDKILIELLDNLQTQFEPTPNKDKIDETLIAIISEFQKILKVEWDRVKQEVIAGKEINNKKDKSISQMQNN